jgi:hypothetical protein
MVQDRGYEGSRQPRGRKLDVILSNAYMLTEQKAPSVQFALAQLYKIKTPSQEKLVNSKITLHVDPSTNLITKYVYPFVNTDKRLIQ